MEPEPHPVIGAHPAGPSLSRPLLVVALGVLLGLLAALAFGIYRYVQPLPVLVPVTSFPASVEGATAPGSFPWPGQGQAAIAVDGIGLVANHGAALGARPIASTTKIMTALLILEHHPLAPGEDGPTLTLTRADEADYLKAVSLDESSVPVQAGEQITERQLLEGLLLPSANNFARILAIWDAGSEASFVAAMNARAKALGMHDTTFADSSGFSDKTVSTAVDMLTLIQVAMRDAAFAQVAGMASATLPVAGEVHNTNMILGKDGVIAGKTGSTEQAGGCLIVAADRPDSTGKTQRVYVVVMGTLESKDSLENVFPATTAILDAIPQWLVSKRVISAGQAAGSYTAPWGGSVDAVSASDLTVTAWAGTPISDKVTLDPIHAPIGETSKVGEITVTAGDRTQRVDLVTAGGLAGPGLAWRLNRN